MWKREKREYFLGMRKGNDAKRKSHKNFHVDTSPFNFFFSREKITKDISVLHTETSGEFFLFITFYLEMMSEEI